MIDLRPVLYILGIFLITMAIAMAVPVSFDLYAGNPDWRAFLFGMAVTGFFGILLVLTNRPDEDAKPLVPKQAFVLTGISWIVISCFAAIPFAASELGLSLTDAYFEAMAGLTTTGATILTNLDNTPPGILIWRAILQWLGGVGIIVMALSILPMLRVGGMQLFRTEFSETDRHMPKARHLAASIMWVYIGMTVLCMIGYAVGGMTSFDALAHALTTISTGGFSTRDASFMDGVSAFTQYNAVFFMFAAGFPFALMAKAMMGSWSALFKDPQVRSYIGLVIAAVSVFVLYGWFRVDLSFADALRSGSFSVISIITGTGYANTDYMLWGSFAFGLIFFLSCTGACAGSSSGGIKIYRFHILASVTLAQMRQLIHPNGVFVPQYNGKELAPPIRASVYGFFFIFALSFVLVALALALTGTDWMTALSASVSTLANVGPGIGPVIGPTGTYEPLSDASTWVCIVAMVLGRLELFTLLVLLMPSFWRR